MELTKEQFDKAIAPLATSLELKQVYGRLTGIEETLAAHTTALDAIAKNTSDWRTEQAALTGRLDRHEAIIKELARKARLKLDW
jgi:hypothetical protein